MTPNKIEKTTNSMGMEVVLSIFGQGPPFPLFYFWPRTSIPIVNSSQIEKMEEQVAQWVDEYHGNRDQWWSIESLYKQYLQWKEQHEIKQFNKIMNQLVKKRSNKLQVRICTIKDYRKRIACPYRLYFYCFANDARPNTYPFERVYLTAKTNQQRDTNVKEVKDRATPSSTNPSLRSPLSYTTAPAVVDILIHTPTQPPTKRQRITNEPPSPPNASVPEATTVTPPRYPTRPHVPIELTDYFHSNLARKNFGYKHPLNYEDQTKPVEEIICGRIRRFYNAAYSCEGWKDVLEDEDVDNKMNHYHIYKIKHKSLFLCRTLTIFLTKKRQKLDIDLRQCCIDAVMQIKSERQDIVDIIENDSIQNDYPCPDTIMAWHRTFRNHYESFPNICHRRSITEKYPPFLANNPDYRKRIIDYAHENIHRLSGELIHAFISNVLFPELLAERIQATGRNDMSMSEVMKEQGLSKLTLSTVYNWMERLNFKYKPRTQTYYVDGHEFPATVEDRKRYIRKYLKDEFRCYRWIQLPEEEVDVLADKDDTFNKEIGYKYTQDNSTYYEFHVDDHPSFQERCNNNPSCPFGGFLSVRFPTDPPNLKPIIKIGQDESIYKQYTISKRQWFLPDGTSAPNPKTEGDGVMISGFTSRDFGFGFDLSPAQLGIVNEYRRTRGHDEYVDKEAAIKIKNTTRKSNLTKSPFVYTFDYGANHEGYWNYDNMVIQLEDVVDCLRALYQDQHHYIFFFDHSSGHDRLRPDGLNAKEVSKYYGGGRKLRNTKILDATYLGPNNPMLHVGDTQLMTFVEGDIGPFYLTPEEREANKHDRVIDVLETKKYTKNQLKQKIKDLTGVDVTGTLKDIQERAQVHSIPIEYQANKIKKGWLGSSKGMLQILFERGILDTNGKTNNEIDKFYTVLGKQDENGNRIEGTSLRFLLSSLPDFKNEMTLLQYRAEQLGVEIDCSPKYHPEIAGEGIEYVWGFSKSTYRRMPLGTKKKQGFRELVTAALNTNNVLTVSAIRKCAKRARMYMLAYHSLAIARETFDNGNDGRNGDDGKIQLPPMTGDLVERLVKKYEKKHRTHRCTMDQETAFIDEVLLGMMRNTHGNTNT